MMQVIYLTLLTLAISYFMLLVKLWEEYTSRGGNDYDAFLANYMGTTLGYGISYLIFPCVILLFKKGRSLNNFVLATIILAPLLFYFSQYGKS